MDVREPDIGWSATEGGAAVVRDDDVAISQIEAQLRVAGIKDNHSVENILEMIREYARLMVRAAVAQSVRENRVNQNGRLSALHSPPTVPEGMAWCGRCDDVLPRSEFYRDSGKVGGRRVTCKECERRMRVRRTRARRIRLAEAKASCGEG